MNSVLSVATELPPSIAHHESGHIIAAIQWLRHTPSLATTHGTHPGQRGYARIQLTSKPRAAHSDPEWRRIRVPEAAMSLAGLAAEEVAGYGRSPGISDLEAIVAVQGRGAVNAIVTGGMLPPVEKATDDVEGALSAILEAFPTKIDPLARLLRLYSFVLRSMSASRATLERLATELRARGTLTADEMDAVVGADLVRRRV